MENKNLRYVSVYKNTDLNEKLAIANKHGSLGYDEDFEMQQTQKNKI